MRLNLPTIDAQLKQDSSGMKIYDSIRQKYVALTPEEWVRQHFVHFLIKEKKVPVSFLANEIGLTLNGTRRRCDTVIFTRSARPLAIVEYKAPSVNITQNVFDQIVRYNMVLRTRYLIVSNGLHHYCCEMLYEQGTYRFLEEVPCYDDMIENK